MVFSLSPAVDVKESSVDSTFTEVAATGGAYCAAFNWGPVEEVTTVSSEAKLISIFAKPDLTNNVHWWSAANFLSYGNNLKVVRVIGSEALNASNDKDIVEETFNGDATTSEFETEHVFVKLPSKIEVFSNGEKLTADSYDVSLTGENKVKIKFKEAPAAGKLIKVETNKIVIKNESQFSLLSNLNAQIYAKYPGDKANGLTIQIATKENWNDVKDLKIFSYEPGENEISVAIIDNGQFDTEGSIIWLQELMSTKVSQVKTGEMTNYFESYINNNCPYIWVNGDISNLTKVVLSGGVTDNNVSDADRINGYKLFRATETVDFRALIGGVTSSTLANYLISNVAEFRKDCVAFLSPDALSMNSNDLEKSIITFRNTLPSSSYYMLDGNWKYQYDPYNDVYIWVPVNADIAGLYVRTADNNEPWFSPAGYNRGVLKNVIKLKWNPDKASRDELYSNNINPVIIESGFGALLLGDKTGLKKPSAFSRINVRMLFIIMEKAVATFAKYSLFEFNDAHTRSAFVNRTNNYLSNVAGRRGIEDDYFVKCDDENNDAIVKNANGFKAAIKVRPLRSINFIELSFSSYDYGVEFDEIA